MLSNLFLASLPGILSVLGSLSADVRYHWRQSPKAVEGRSATSESWKRLRLELVIEHALLWPSISLPMYTHETP